MTRRSTPAMRRWAFQGLALTMAFLQGALEWWALQRNTR